MKLSNKDYKKIVSELKLDVNADIHSTRQVELLMQQYFPTSKQNVLDELTRLLKSPCLIAGAGPSLEHDIRTCNKNDILEKVTLIAVDGTCSLFHQLHITPQILVTDLDGDWYSILWAIRQGAITLIHAHGDNLNIIEKFFQDPKEWEGNNKIWGTTQNDLKTDFFNFGGFTDGDRAIFLAFHFQTPLIGLVGFDFGNKIGQYSTLNPYLKKNVSIKQKKFKIALSLISKYHHKHKGQRINLTSQGEKIYGFNHSSALKFSDLLDEWYEKQNILGFPR